MKVTPEALQIAYTALTNSPGSQKAALLSAIESLPEPLPRLRPLAEMHAEVPEGAVRLLVSSNQRPAEDVLGIDVLPPLPESPKPSLQDELVTALELLVKEMDSEIHDRYDGTSSLESRLAELDKARALIAKVKGGQQ